MKIARTVWVVFCLAALGACGGGGPSSKIELPPIPPETVVTIEGDIKQLIFSWTASENATYFRLLENADGMSGFTQVGENIPGGTLAAKLNIAVHLFDWVEAQYIVEACNARGCSSSDVATVTDVMLDTIGYFKASNTGGNQDLPDPFLVGDWFGWSVALSADGTTMAVGAPREDSSSTGINGDQDDNSAFTSGAVYLFRYDGTEWTQQAYIKASHAEGCEHHPPCPDTDDLLFGDEFGFDVALSGDGNTLVVGAPGEDSAATEINGDQADNSSFDSGAVYVFRFDGVEWIQQTYIKASDGGGRLGTTVDVGRGGERIAAGAWQAETAYIFDFDGTDWNELARLTASNRDPVDGFFRVALSREGDTLIVGASEEDSGATGIDGDQNDNSVRSAGAVYVFRFDGVGWSQQAYIKASNTGLDSTGWGDDFGSSVALSGDGDTLLVGAQFEDSGAIGVNGDQSDDSMRNAGAVYVFRFNGIDWSQQAYIKPSDTQDGQVFGRSLTVNEQADMFIVNGVYVFRFDGNEWAETARITPRKAGADLAMSADGQTLAAGAYADASGATGIGGDQDDNSAGASGAVYVY